MEIAQMEAMVTSRKELAKAIAAAAFRNGEIENVHAGKICPACFNKPEYSHISQAEMKGIMQDAVNRVYSLIHYYEHDRERFIQMIAFHGVMTKEWDEPRLLDLF